jgi:hypothetical protein
MAARDHPGEVAEGQPRGCPHLDGSPQHSPPSKGPGGQTSARETGTDRHERIIRRCRMPRHETTCHCHAARTRCDGGAATEREPGAILVRAARVIAGRGGAPIANAAILIRRERIERIGPAADLRVGQP